MLRYISIFAILVAGGAHLLIAPEHFSHALAHGFFFILIGLAQVGWAITFWQVNSRALYWTGLAVSGGTVVLWALTWLVSVPLALEPEPVDAVVVLIKISEVIGFDALVALKAGHLLKAGTRWAVPRLVAAALLLALVAGAGAWGGGHLAGTISGALWPAESHEAGSGHHNGHELDQDHE